ncbi:MAG TPA: nucleotidyltransferase domain-containing protein [Thermoplasmata archaeon]|nr:nucleotidyltransferase domain-containing protein [Thermoplasmata archaeon]
MAIDPRWAAEEEGHSLLERFRGRTFYPVLALALAGSFQIFGGRLRAIALFGSCARGEETPDSDVDLLLVVDPLPASLMSRIAEISPVAIECRRLLPPGGSGSKATHSPQFVVLSQAELDGEPSLLLDLTEDAVIFYDAESTLGRVLGRLRGKLKSHGSQRVRPIGESPYWILHPGAAPGEIGEL